MKNIQTISEFNELPKTGFVILFPETIHVPGDERSRTNPGHGYGPYTHKVWRVNYYETKEEWIEEIKKYSTYKDGFIPLQITKPTIEVKNTIDINI